MIKFICLIGLLGIGCLIGCIDSPVTSSLLIVKAGESLIVTDKAENKYSIIYNKLGWEGYLYMVIPNKK